VVASWPHYTANFVGSHAAGTIGNSREPAVFQRPQNSSNVDIVLENICNNMELFFWKIVKIEFGNKSNTLFSRKVSTNVCKTRSSITFTSLNKWKESN